MQTISGQSVGQISESHTRPWDASQAPVQLVAGLTSAGLQCVQPAFTRPVVRFRDSLDSHGRSLSGLSNVSDASEASTSSLRGQCRPVPPDHHQPSIQAACSAPPAPTPGDFSPRASSSSCGTPTSGARDPIILRLASGDLTSSLLNSDGPDSPPFSSRRASFHRSSVSARIDFPQNLQSPRRGPRPSGPAPSPAQAHQQLRHKRKIERSKSLPWAASMGALVDQAPVDGEPCGPGYKGERSSSLPKAALPTTPREARVQPLRVVLPATGAARPRAFCSQIVSASPRGPQDSPWVRRASSPPAMGTRTAEGSDNRYACHSRRRQSPPANRSAVLCGCVLHRGCPSADPPPPPASPPLWRGQNV